MKEFQPFTLEDLNISFIDGDRGKNYPSQHDFSDKGYSIFLNTKNVRKYGFDFSDIQYISKEKDSALRKGKVQDKDIILTTRGTVGNTAYYEQSIHYENVRINSGMVIVRPDEKTVDSRFLLYFFRSLDYDIFVSGSAQPQLPIRDLKKIEIHLPPLIEQKAIASVLSSLDEKIELLHRQNKTLESMAETLFRQWFDNEQQDNLKEGKLSDILSLKYGKALKQENRSGEGFPVVASGGIVGFHSEYLVNAPGIVIGRKGTLGKVYYMYENFYPIDTSYYIESKIKNSELFYEYFLLKALDFENMNSDSAVPGLNRDYAMSSSINIPSFEMIINFNKFCKGFFEKIKINSTQINTLENLRDTLLLKLMSGEVRVEYAEEAISSIA
ncbi:restriction endonuclease subunit S [Serratia marcescens]|uniref:restriction endonuclease subunit S n=1 Tax=Serratia marcescens TaxID=615 RepID=UPI000927035E|nr:restriction endonuclease subunit S [Serratia marcescens]OJH81867.1 type I restriction-modification system specificity subunit [Serratia marcescens]